MNRVYITDNDGNLLPYARHLVDAIAFYRGDFACVQQMRLLLEDEYNRFCDVGDDGYQPSGLCKDLLNAMGKRAEAVYSTGLVGLVLIGLNAQDKTPSLDAAYELVKEYSGNNHKTSFLFYSHEDGTFEPKDRNVASSERSIRRAYSDYKSALHICAARVAANFFLLPLGPFESAPEADHCYVSTVATFQGFFSERDMTVRDPRRDELNLCEIAWHEGFEFQGVPLFPTVEFLNEIND